MNGDLNQNAATQVRNRHMRHTSHMSHNRDLDESALLLDESHDRVQQQIRGTVGRRGGT